MSAEAFAATRILGLGESVSLWVAGGVFVGFSGVAVWWRAYDALFPALTIREMPEKAEEFGYPDRHVFRLVIHNEGPKTVRNVKVKLERVFPGELLSGYSFRPSGTDGDGYDAIDINPATDGKIDILAEETRKNGKVETWTLASSKMVYNYIEARCSLTLAVEAEDVLRQEIIWSLSKELGQPVKIECGRPTFSPSAAATALGMQKAAKK